MQIKSQTILEEESQKKIPTSTLFSSNNNDEREMIQSTQLIGSLVPKLRPLNTVHNYERTGLLDDLL